MAALPSSSESVLSPLDLPENERQEIIALYRNGILSGSQARLVGPAGKSFVLPQSVYKLLLQILKDLSEGMSVAVLQERQGVTTVQASKLLGVSRQYLVNLIDRGDIPHHMVGTHRRIYIKDLMAFKAQRDRARRAVLGEMARSEIEAGVYNVVPDDLAGQ